MLKILRPVADMYAKRGTSAHVIIMTCIRRLHHATLNQRLYMHRRAIRSCFRSSDFVEGLPPFALSGAVDKNNRCKRYSPTVLLNSDCQQRLTMIQQIASTLCHEVDCNWCTLGLVQNCLNTKTCVVFTFLYYNLLLRYLYFHFWVTILFL